MSFIAAVLLLNMDVADAFICFANLLNRPCQVAFFRIDEAMVCFSLEFLTYKLMICCILRLERNLISTNLFVLLNSRRQQNTAWYYLLLYMYYFGK